MRKLPTRTHRRSYLGAYIDGLQRENLSIGIGSGDVVLENLQLKRDALDELDLPVTVKAGADLIVSIKRFNQSTTSHGCLLTRRASCNRILG